MDYEAYFGAVNEEKFNDFVMHKLVHWVNRYPQPRSVVILDNIKFHHNVVFRQTISEIGAICAYLPHYDPYYNLTEYVFRDIKSIEVAKGIYGEKESLLSLVESVESLRNKNYSNILTTIGHCNDK